MQPNDDNGWGEWRKYVLKALEANESDHKEIMLALSELHVEVARLQVKSGVWGAVAGAIAGAVPLLIALLVK